MTNILPELEIKLNSEHYDFIQTEKPEENKVILQQFADDRELAYICLNGVQVYVPIKDLKVAVDALYKNKEIALEEEIKTLQLELEKQKIMTEMAKQQEINS